MTDLSDLYSFKGVLGTQARGKGGWPGSREQGWSAGPAAGPLSQSRSKRRAGGWFGPGSRACMCVWHGLLQSSGVGWPSGLSRLPIRAGAPSSWSASPPTRRPEPQPDTPAGISALPRASWRLLTPPGCSLGFRFLTAAACTDLAAFPLLQTRAVEKETLEGPGTRTGRQAGKAGRACGHCGVGPEGT